MRRARRLHSTRPARIWKKTGIPFVSDISVAALIADYPNVFTTRPSEDEEHMPVIAELVKQMKIARPAFVGLDGQLADKRLAMR